MARLTGADLADRQPESRRLARHARPWQLALPVLVIAAMPGTIGLAANVLSIEQSVGGRQATIGLLLVLVGLLTWAFAWQLRASRSAVGASLLFMLPGLILLSAESGRVLGLNSLPAACESVVPQPATEPITTAYGPMFKGLGLCTVVAVRLLDDVDSVRVRTCWEREGRSSTYSCSPATGLRTGEWVVIDEAPPDGDRFRIDVEAPAPVRLSTLF